MPDGSIPDGSYMASVVAYERPDVVIDTDRLLSEKGCVDVEII